MDEFLFEYEESPVSLRSGGIQSIQLLMVVNREIYFEFPVLPLFQERIHRMLSSLENWRFNLMKNSF